MRLAVGVASLLAWCFCAMSGVARADEESNAYERWEVTIGESEIDESQAEASEPAPRPLSPARFATLDSFDRNSGVGVQFSAADLPGRGVHASRIGIDARDMRGRYGGYFGFGIGSVSREGGVYSAAEGGIEIGGLWHAPVEPVGLLVRAGLMFTLGQADQTGLETNLAIASERLTDFAVMLPESIGFRLSTSWFGRRGPAFARADLGLDAVVDSVAEERPGFPASGNQLLERFNLGAGLALGDAAFVIELASLRFATSELVDDRLRHVACAGAHYRLGPLELGASVVKQLESPDSAPFIGVVTVELAAFHE